MEDQSPTQEQTDAFNAGYLLQQYQPEMLNGILKSNDGKSQYLDMLEKGQQKYLHEKVVRQQQNIKENQKAKRPGR